MLAFIFIAIALIINLAGFFILSDISQMFFSFPRSYFYNVINNRYKLMGLSAVSFILGVLMLYSDGASIASLIIWFAIFDITLFSGYWIAPLMIFPSQQKSAQYVSIAEAMSHLKDEEEVNVLVVNGDARAFATDWIIRPHVAGVQVGGEDVVMTYCGLSHLGIPFKNQNLDLVAMAQIECNLLLVDNNTNEPIQQISGTKVNDDTQLDRIPSAFMSFGAYKKLYPEGKVFFNPPANPLDKIIRKALNFLVYGTQYNPEKEQFAFPNVPHVDNRIPLKEQVYGVEINGEAVAYRLDHLRKSGHIVDTVGGETITVKYFADYDYIDMFYGDTPDVMPLDEEHKVPHASRILWGIWSNFYQDTAVRA
jgi:hypothetical protein